MRLADRCSKPSDGGLVAVLVQPCAREADDVPERVGGAE
jgi:hypothetical protein